MKCKQFSSKDGYLIQGIGKTPILIEEAINKWLASNPSIVNMAQSQSGENGNYVTVTFLYK